MNAPSSDGIVASLREAVAQGDRRMAMENAGRAADEIERLREGLQLIATDEHRLMNVTARNVAQSILDGKPSGVRK